MSKPNATSQGPRCPSPDTSSAGGCSPIDIDGVDACHACEFQDIVFQSNLKHTCARFSRTVASPTGPSGLWSHADEASASSQPGGLQLIIPGHTNDQGTSGRTLTSSPSSTVVPDNMTEPSHNIVINVRPPSSPARTPGVHNPPSSMYSPPEFLSLPSPQVIQTSLAAAGRALSMTPSPQVYDEHVHQDMLGFYDCLLGVIITFFRWIWNLIQRIVRYRP